MRIFSGIKIEDEIVNEIKKLLNTIEKHKDRIRIVPPKNLHLTLRFLGNINEEKYARFSEKLSILCSKLEVFQINIAGLGFFPHKNKARVIWVGVEDNPNLMKVYLATEDAAHEIGLPPENKFKGHITVGRIKNFLPSEIINEIERKFRDCFWGKMMVKKITIFESVLHPEGSEYRELLNIPMGGN